MKELIANLLASVEWPTGYTEQMKMDVLAQSTNRLTEHLTAKVKALPGYSSDDDLDALRTSLRKHPENFSAQEQIARHYQEMAVLERYAASKGHQLNIEQGAVTEVLKAQVSGRKALKSDEDIKSDVKKLLASGKSVELVNLGVGKADMLDAEIGYRATMAQYLKENGRPAGTAREDASILGRVKDAWNGVTTSKEQVKKAALAVDVFVSANPTLPPERIAQLSEFSNRLQTGIEEFPDETLKSLTVPESDGQTTAQKVTAPLKQQPELMSEQQVAQAKQAAKAAVPASKPASSPAPAAKPDKQEITPMEPKTVKAVVGGKEVTLVETEDGLIDEDEVKKREEAAAKAIEERKAQEAAAEAQKQQEEFQKLPPKEKATKMSEMIQKALEAQENGNVQDAIMNGAGVFSNLATLFTGLKTMNEELPELRESKYLNEMLAYSRKLADTGMDPTIREQREGDIRRGLDKDLETVKRNVGGDAAGVLGNRFASTRDYYNALAQVSAEDIQIKMSAVPLHMSALEQAQAAHVDNFNRKFEIAKARTDAGASLVSQSFQNMHNREQMQRHYGKGSVNQVLAWAELQRAKNQYMGIEGDSAVSVAENAAVGASDEQVKASHPAATYGTQQVQNRVSNPSVVTK